MSQMISSAQSVMVNGAAVVAGVAMINPNVTVIAGGSFVGTLALQCCRAGFAPNWQTIGTPLTAPGVIAVQNLAGDLQFQLIFTAYTSGSANVYMAACPSS